MDTYYRTRTIESGSKELTDPRFLEFEILGNECPSKAETWRNCGRLDWCVVVKARHRRSHKPHYDWLWSSADSLVRLAPYPYSQSIFYAHDQ